MIADRWLEVHPYFRPLADLVAHVDRAAAGIEIRHARVPDWEDYDADYRAGVTLLTSADTAVDLEPGARITLALLERLASATPSGILATEAGTLVTDLRREPQI